MCGYFVAVDFSTANCFIVHILEAVIPELRTFRAGVRFMRDDGTALAEGFYWYAEKLMWGYEGTPADFGGLSPNDAWAVAATLGFSFFGFLASRFPRC
jgi:hypothetical protein